MWGCRGVRLTQCDGAGESASHSGVGAGESGSHSVVGAGESGSHSVVGAGESGSHCGRCRGVSLTQWVGAGESGSHSVVGVCVLRTCSRFKLVVQLGL